VFIRLIGQVRMLRGEDQRAWREQLLDLQAVEVATGSGFIVSPDGWVVTNHHVITGEKFVVTVRDQKVEVSISVDRIEVVLPARSPTQPARPYTATVYAADPDLDIALLRIVDTDLPYVGLGDSDVVEPGEQIQAVGYPFGAKLEIAKTETSDAVPNPTVSSGTISALRADMSGERRYIQVSAVLNPGNSGGPVVDADGYAIGVARSRIEAAADIGFAVPINRVKRLLLTHGLDASLPVQLLSPGAFLTNQDKGINLRVPAGFEDRSPARLRIEAAPLLPTTREPQGQDAQQPREDLVLRIDRVATSQAVDVIGRALVNEGAFERFRVSGNARRFSAPRENGVRVVSGYATGTNPTTGDDSRLVFAIIDFGKEKVVARYVGPADTVAANRSVLQASLAELDARQMLTAEVTSNPSVAWTPARSSDGRLGIQTVAGWVVEPGTPWRCAELPTPSSGLTMSPAGDFTVALRAVWHPASSADTTAAARKCSAQPGTSGPASYAARATAFGIVYQLDGIFARQADGSIWQLEMIAPVEKRKFVAAIFHDWIASIAQ
jgi:trypsin-like peptidase